MTQPSDLFLDRYHQAFEQELRDALSGEEGLLQKMFVYQLGWMDEQGMPLSGLGGERRHPLLCLLSCEALSGEYGLALPAAAALELVHNFSLIHEDVQTGSPNRGPRPTVWWIWGPGQAINAGDGMHALARLSLMRLQERGLPVARVIEAMRLMDQSCLSMCEGQHLDLAFQERLDLSVDSYLKMAGGKTGALMSCAMGLGALAAAEDDSVVEAFKSCGRDLGIAHQIRSDVDEIRRTSKDEASSGNVLIKKKLLPIVYALETGDIHTKRELGNIYFKRVLEPEDVERVINILNEGSALEYAEMKVEELCRTALDSLKGVDLSAWGREEMRKLCRHISTGEV
jgi:geranylgeranyl diphosphate synthase type I